VHVILDDERGRVIQQDQALGWIMFDPSGVPEPLVHLSHRLVPQSTVKLQGIAGGAGARSCAGA
jgi:hypothetical protein